MSMDLAKALQHHCKDIKCEYITGETYEDLVWLCEEHSKPTEEDLELAWLEYIEIRELNKYKELRAAEYPAIVDQLDMIYHGGLEAWRAQIEAIKLKYPKPE
jgi:hypothetical protein